MTWKIHPGFNIADPSRANDIALIDMRGSGLELTDRIGTICKPTVSPAVGDVLTIMGWGVTDDPPTQVSPISGILKKVN